MADRADWDAATRAQRQLAVAADAELRRRHPDQHFPPLRSAEPQPATAAQRDDLTLAAGEQPGEMAQWIKDLAAGHRTFADPLADRQSLKIPSEDPDYGDLGPAFPAWPRTGQGRDLATAQARDPAVPAGPPARRRTVTPTGRPQIDSSPVHPGTREVTAGGTHSHHQHVMGGVFGRPGSRTTWCICCNNARPSTSGGRLGSL